MQAPWSQDGELYDAVVLEVLPDDEIRVRFTEDGVKEVVPIENVQKLAKRGQGKNKEPPKPSLKRYPVLKKSLVLPTVDWAVTLYGPCYVGKRVVERQGYETPRLEHRKPLVLRLLDDDGERVIDELRIVRMTGWEVVAYDLEAHLGVFGFDPRRVEQLYDIRGCILVNSIPVTPHIRANLFEYSVDALVALVRRKGLQDNQSVLCDCFTILAGGVVALAHDPAAQKDYCETLVDIVGDLFRTDLAEVTVATELLALATPVDCAKLNIQASSLSGHLGKLASFCDAVGVRLPISSVVSVIPSGGSRAAEIYAAASGTDRKGVFMVTGAKKYNGRSIFRRPIFC